MTANILAHNEDLPEARRYFEELRAIGPDALIISDPGIFAIARETAPELEIHISTQANNTNYGTYQFWHKLGAKRVVSARELSLAELSQIRRRIPEEMEMETFIHGAMCISYSGRCLLSNYFTGRDANQGACTHPCRWNYAVMEESRPGEYLPVYENERGTFLFNSKDLCMIEHIPELLKTGIDSLKIEGRMKTALYVAAVVRTYRKAIDDCLEDEALYRSRMGWYQAEVEKCTTRPFTTGFFFGKPGADTQIYESSTYRQEFIYLGMAGEALPEGRFFLEQKNKFSVGETVEIVKPSGENLTAVVESISDLDGREQESAPHARQELSVKLSRRPEKYDILRKKGVSV